jgi:hypothetical protein
MMKKCMWMLVVMAFAASAMGQILGLPVGGGAVAPGAGTFAVSGGGVFNGDVSLYGGRVAYGVTEGLAVFGDAGLMDVDGLDIGFAFQAGALYVLPFELPVDLALRATAGTGSADTDNGNDVSLMSLNGGLVVSKTLDIFTPYAFLGLSYVDTEVTPNKRSRSIQEDMTDVMLAGGVSVAPTEQLSLYVEVALIELTEWIDDVFVGAGVRWAF